MWEKSEAFQRISELAGRTTEAISRRRFAAWLGGAAASMLGLTVPLDAHGRVACRDVRAEQVRGPATFSARVCVPAGTCSPPNAAAVAAAGLQTCRTLVQRACDRAAPCPIPQQCRAYVVPGSTVSAVTSSDLGRLNCPAGQTTCVIELRLLEGQFITCACQCEN